MFILVEGRFFREEKHCSSGIGTFLFGLYGCIVISMVERSFILTMVSLGLIASTRRSQKSQPSITAVASFLVTKKFTTSVFFQFEL